MRRSPLGRKKPAPRHAAQSMTKDDLSAVAATPPPPPRRVRETGFPPAVRKLIDFRDSDNGLLLPYVRCQSCGRVDLPERMSIQHRIARHMGGTSNPLISSVINGVRMCGTATSPGGCHAAAEARNAILYNRGFWRAQHEIDTLPLIPVVRFNRHAYWPTEDGRWLLEAPAGDAA